MLKAAEALRSFAFESYGADGDVVDDVFLGGMFPPGINALKLRWGFGRSSVPPAFKESFVACFAQLPNLTTLILELDFEKAANDTNFMVRTMKAIDLSWVNRCLHRRLRATKALVDACPTLETAGRERHRQLGVRQAYLQGDWGWGSQDRADFVERGMDGG
ncbi:hypothetical protein Hypma_009457 [Hypsizygus marmoreus]|uniref:F-box domain-containing protein n=1 Tax=Hypsizygus marmoreus TaxID=39966 RepID=A0A369JNJ6_HYPMA|nr:hypothetical protein Hypma_009457 [Hypsizygus marmoreus]